MNAKIRNHLLVALVTWVKRLTDKVHKSDGKSEEVADPNFDPFWFVLEREGAVEEWQIPRILSALRLRVFNSLEGMYVVCGASARKDEDHAPYEGDEQGEDQP